VPFVIEHETWPYSKNTSRIVDHDETAHGAGHVIRLTPIFGGAT
jgi:hypothetical protein